MAKISLARSSYLNFADLLEYDGCLFFDTPNYVPVPESTNDIYITVDSENMGRLDLIAFDYYGDAELWWVIALANNLDNLPTQLRSGLRIRIPDPSSIDKYLGIAANVTAV